MAISTHIDVLLVEDDPSDAELTLNGLRSHDLAKNIVVVRDGSEAIDFIKAHGTREMPRLILLDLKLPKVDGFQVLRCLKSNEQTKSIPVVVFTSSGLADDVQECYMLGANSYVQKPMDYDSFMKTITEISLYWLSVNSPPIEESPTVMHRRRAG